MAPVQNNVWRDGSQATPCIDLTHVPTHMLALELDCCTTPCCTLDCNLTQRHNSHFWPHCKTMRNQVMPLGVFSLLMGKVVLLKEGEVIAIFICVIVSVQTALILCHFLCYCPRFQIVSRKRSSDAVVGVLAFDGGCGVMKWGRGERYSCLCFV